MGKTPGGKRGKEKAKAKGAHKGAQGPPLGAKAGLKGFGAPAAEPKVKKEFVKKVKKTPEEKAAAQAAAEQEEQEAAAVLARAAEQAVAEQALKRAAADRAAAERVAAEQAAAEEAAAKQAAAERAAAVERERAAAQREVEERHINEAMAQSMASLQADEERRRAPALAAAAPAAAPPAAAPMPPPPPPAVTTSPDAPLKLTYAELSAATSNFAQSTLVGVGGFGSVYRSDALPSLTQLGPCAVKRLTPAGDGGLDRGGRGGGRGLTGRGGRGAGVDSSLKEAMKEVELLRRCAPHANLLPLLGYCLEPMHAPCLIFPLCLGGTLEDRLMPHSAAAKTRLFALGWAEPPAPLAWQPRLVALREAARALAHLHAQRLLHGDVKPSNILLAVDGSSARLADFGLARAAKRQEGAAPGATAASVSGVKGSAAFLDPI